MAPRLLTRDEQLALALRLPLWGLRRSLAATAQAIGCGPRRARQLEAQAFAALIDLNEALAPIDVASAEVAKCEAPEVVPGGPPVRSPQALTVPQHTRAVPTVDSPDGRT